MKKLILTYSTAGTGTVTCTIENPKDDLTLATVKEQAPAIGAVLVTRSGIAAQDFLKAVISSTTEEELS